MRNASTALINFLNALSAKSEPYIADLLTIIQQNGTVTRLTNAGTDINSTSQAITPGDLTVYTFLCGGVTFSRGRVRTIIGLEVDNMPISLMTDPTRDLLGGIPWPSAARQGAFDGARFVLERLFMPTWNDHSLGTLIIFAGTSGEVAPTRSSVQVNVVADINILGNKMPRNIYQPGCLHRLYDSGCTLLQASFTVSGAVASGGSVAAIRTNLTQADNYFELGAITFTSGVLNGQTFSVKGFAHTNGLVTPVAHFPSNPANGDTFTIYPGCDKAQATCSGKFSNVAHFRGYPYIPCPEAAG